MIFEPDTYTWLLYQYYYTLLSNIFMKIVKGLTCTMFIIVRHTIIHGVLLFKHIIMFAYTVLIIVTVCTNVYTNRVSFICFFLFCFLLFHNLFFSKRTAMF